MLLLLKVSQPTTKHNTINMLGLLNPQNSFCGSVKTNKVFPNGSLICKSSPAIKINSRKPSLGVYKKITLHSPGFQSLGDNLSMIFPWGQVRAAPTAKSSGGCKEKKTNSSNFVEQKIQNVCVHWQKCPQMVRSIMVIAEPRRSKQRIVKCTNTLKRKLSSYGWLNF